MADDVQVSHAGEMNGSSGTVAVDSESQAAERRRVQELLRYFQPSDQNTDLPQKPRVSSDLALNAFAQLAALKLNCERSFISLMDHEHQYIIAECTRSMSLESADSYEGEGDALLTGATTIDLNWGVCASTISVFNSTDGSRNTIAPYMRAQKDYYIMNDMSKLPDYKDRPYVAGWPYMKYYLEVPIHSPSGLAIGTICGVTNEAREGVDYKAIAILNEIASAVMDHLDLVVSRVQRKRAERMINGLGLFAEGSDDSHWWTKRRKSAVEIEVEEQMRRLTVQGQEGSVGVLGSPDHDDSASSQLFTSGNALDYFDIGKPRTEAGTVTPTTPNISTPMVKSATDSDESISKTESTSPRSQPRQIEVEPAKEAPAAKTEDDFPRQQSSGLSTHKDGTLARATRLIREAVDLDCVAFFDTRVSAPVLYTTGIPNASYIHTENNTSAVSGQTFCRELSSSTSEGTIALLSQFPEKLLRHLLKRFPKGGILTFDNAANYVSRCEFDTATYRPSYSTESQASTMSPEHGSSRKSAIEEAKFLKELHKFPVIFPGARKIILFPLTSSSHRLFAYAIGFTTDAIRVLQREDFAYITSFSNLIMSELSRIDSADADLAKSRFISSISHELRSPLHGMLASAELLKDAITDTTSIDIIDTIEACGSTLLDTLDNLLTFAKINNFTVLQQRKASASGGLSSGHGMAGNIKSLESEVNLCSLVEEVMNASIAGHHFRSSPSHSHGVANMLSADESPLTVICDIDFSLNWVFDTQAGAWKRILMNLLGNSLKYTTCGLIKVTLKQEKGGVLSSGQQRTIVSLVVEDTGKGIHADFLANHLYKPFRQENELQPGTGLGLSIVKQLVSSIGGNVEVESKDGCGTSVLVTSSLTTSVNVATPSHFTTTSIGLVSKLKGVKVGLFGMDHNPDIQEIPTGILSREAKRRLALKSTLASGLATFGCHSVTVSSIDADDIDIFISTEDNHQDHLSKSLSPRKAPLILLCSNPSLDYRHVSHVGGPIIYLSQPFGPQRLARALEACQLSYHREDSANTNGDSSLPPATAILKDESSPTVTTLYQPAEAPASPATPSPGASFQVPPSISQEGRPRVLLVEDNAINLRLLVSLARKLDCPYVTATDGKQALDTYVATKGSFDILFMDIQMPIMDGLTASLEIRRFEEQAGLKRTPIIAITGLASADAQEQAKLSGIDSLLTKPVSMKTLRNIIEELPGRGTLDGSDVPLREREVTSLVDIA